MKIRDFSEVPKWLSLNYKDIILVNNKSKVDSRSTDADVSVKFGRSVFKIPVCPANMKSILTKEICRLLDSNGYFYVYHRIDGTEDVFNFVKYAHQNDFNNISISVGIKPEWLDFLKKLKSSSIQVHYITVDVAHSWNDNILPVVDFIKTNFSETFLIVGNGGAPEWIEWLEGLGVDCAKFGIGVSEACRTRQYTGFGTTTVSDLEECVKAANKILVMSDGGISINKNGYAEIGDVAKAISIGADFVMTGAVFARCSDSPAQENGYFGNAALESKKELRHIEGANINVPVTGMTYLETLSLIEESLKSSVSYSGYTSVYDLKKLYFRVIK